MVSKEDLCTNLTSIETEDLSRMDIEIYPNPATNFLNINFPT